MHGAAQHLPVPRDPRWAIDEGAVAGLVCAIKPFAEACQLIHAQYEQLEREHGVGTVRRPPGDAMVFSFSYDTLIAALEAYEQYEARGVTGQPDAMCHVVRIPVHGEHPCAAGLDTVCNRG